MKRNLALIVAALSIAAAACGPPSALEQVSLPKAETAQKIPSDLSRMCYVSVSIDAQGTVRSEEYREEYFEGVDIISKAKYAVDWSAIPCIATLPPGLPGMVSYSIALEFPVAYELALNNIQKIVGELNIYHLRNPGLASIFFNPSIRQITSDNQEERNKSNLQLLVFYTQDALVQLDSQKVWGDLYAILQPLETPPAETPETSQLSTL